MARKRSTKPKVSKVDFPYKEVSLTWIDANSDTGWLTLEQMKKHDVAVCHTQGWVFEETDNYIKIFGTYSIDEDSASIEFGEVIAIPKGWIV
jgi:hypothetical protein